MVLAVVQDGDVIAIDKVAQTLDVRLTDAEIETRLAAWRANPPAEKAKVGVLKKYAKLVSSAHYGAVCV
jgi:dihydroxy-acid dehydratase